MMVPTAARRTRHEMDAIFKEKCVLLEVRSSDFHEGLQKLVVLQSYCTDWSSI